MLSSLSEWFAAYVADPASFVLVFEGLAFFLLLFIRIHQTSVQVGFFV
jgi:hypothetical protein